MVGGRGHLEPGQRDALLGDPAQCRVPRPAAPQRRHGSDIGIKKPGDPGKVMSTALDPLRVDPKDYKLEFENSQVRVLRVKIGPRQSVPMHEYVLNHVVVYLTDQNVRETSPEGKAEVVQHKAGDFIWERPLQT